MLAIPWRSKSEYASSRAARSKAGNIVTSKRPSSINAFGQRGMPPPAYRPIANRQCQEIAFPRKIVREQRAMTLGQFRITRDPRNRIRQSAEPLLEFGISLHGDTRSKTAGGQIYERP